MFKVFFTETRCLLEDRPVEPLETQCWLDLAVCPYTPYAYIHCNMCEHFLVIKQVRLAHPVLDADVLKSPEGVVEVAKHKARRKICRVCDYYFAEWILRDDKLLPENPCFLCQQCFESLHYTADGGLAYGDFEMFPYLGAD